MYKNIRNPLSFFLKKWLLTHFFGGSRILLQASLHRLSDLLPMVSSYFGYIKIYLAYEQLEKEKNKNVSRETFVENKEQ